MTTLEEYSEVEITEHNLESGVDIGQGIDVGPGKFVKTINVGLNVGDSKF